MLESGPGVDLHFEFIFRIWDLLQDKSGQNLLLLVTLTSKREDSLESVPNKWVLNRETLINSSIIKYF